MVQRVFIVEKRIDEKSPSMEQDVGQAQDQEGTWIFAGVCVNERTAKMQIALSNFFSPGTYRQRGISMLDEYFFDEEPLVEPKE